MNTNNRRQQVLEIIEHNPGATGATIFFELLAQSRCARWFGKDSMIAYIFAPSLGMIYVHLSALEREGLIYGTWGVKIADHPRRRHYYREENAPASSN